jgi:hypothetical protein
MKQFKLPTWRRRKCDREPPLKPPIQLGALSNGEMFRCSTPASERAVRMILEKADEGARRLGLDRRDFLASSMGMATSLWVMNAVSGCADREPSSDGMGGGDAGGSGALGPGQMNGSMPSGSGTHDAGGHDAGMMANSARDGGASDGGGYFDVPKDPADPDQVCEKMIDASREFIFDIQTHHVNRANSLYDDFLRDQSQYTGYCAPRGTDPVSCFGRNEYVRLMFLESDTTVAVLSGLPAVDDANNPITNAEIAQTRDVVNMLADGSQRLVNHHMVLPNQMGTSQDAVKKQLDAMARTLDMYKKIGAWKCYPAWSPVNTEQNAPDGWFLDDPATGIPFVQKGLELGVKTFCIHKGLPIPAFSTKYNDPVDIGRVAKMFPEAKFVIYHSAYGHQGYNEGAYMMGSRQGANSLITSLLENNIAPNANVYAELGTTWQLVSTLPVVGGLTAAAHLIGKLLKYVGEDNVVWGTDSIWYGSPQPQIESFLQFQISAQLQQQYGYPALTMERKRKILGLNAAKIYGVDPKAMRCTIDKTSLQAARLLLNHDLGARRWAFGEPLLRTRREFFRLHEQNNFRPG